MKQPPTAADVRATFDYSSSDGRLIWKRARSHRVGKEAGCITATGYRTISWRGNVWLAHRLVWTWVYGAYPECDIDHLNGRRTDNRISNLRLARGSENNRNCAISKANSSGVIGVYWHHHREKWAASIRVNYRRIYLGYFSKLEEAAAARKAAEAKFGFHPNHGRAA